MPLQLNGNETIRFCVAIRKPQQTWCDLCVAKWFLSKMPLILIRMSKPFDASCFHLLVGFDLNFEFKLYQMESFFCVCSNLMLLLISLDWSMMCCARCVCCFNLKRTPTTATLFSYYDDDNTLLSIGCHWLCVVVVSYINNCTCARPPHPVRYTIPNNKRLNVRMAHEESSKRIL